MNSCPRIALTAGEPAGIGPDLCVQIAHTQQYCELVVIADPVLLKLRADSLDIPIDIEPINLHRRPTPAPLGTIRCLPVELAVASAPGVLDSNNASYVLALLQAALNGCMAGQFDAMVTTPVNKAIINQADIPFTGHTEFLAAASDVSQVVMMLTTPSLRVALATTHLPLRDVSSAINQPLLWRIVNIIHQHLSHYFAIPNAHIAVCGLNPHAGEAGHLGREEIEIISPVINQLKSQGINISGPWPADTLFVKETLTNFDVVLAMYHDQGLPVLKHQGFGQAVNVTLGLPFIRTSVDHGTALHLAGTGKATTTSLKSAVDTAVMMIKNRQH